MRDHENMAAQGVSAQMERYPVLVVDDSRTQRLLMQALLVRLGYPVQQVASGEAALELLRETPFKIVISDWMMPGLSGPDLCTALRDEIEDGQRPYLLLLTAKQDRADIAAGLAAGADDFLTKPVHQIELAARLLAGRRILDMQARLTEQRDAADRALAALRETQARMDRDLMTASSLQAALQPPAITACNAAPCAAICRNAGHVGGDLVGHFPIGSTGVGLYSIDVCGHGVAAAIRAVHLSQVLNARDPAHNLALAPGGRARDPAEVVAALNRRFVGEAGEALHFTMVLASLCLVSGEVRFCQAGHPPPIILPQHGPARLVGAGGPPVGLLPDLSYSSEIVRLSPGDRLLLYSDGLCEIAGDDGAMIGPDGVCARVERIRTAKTGATGAILPALLDSVFSVGGGTADDDLSAILIERP